MLEQPIPLMTKLKVSLSMPLIGRRVRKQEIRCTGIVVHQEKTRFKSKFYFLTGIFFSKIAPGEKRSLAEFILQSML